MPAFNLRGRLLLCCAAQLIHLIQLGLQLGWTEVGSALQIRFPLLVMGCSNSAKPISRGTSGVLTSDARRISQMQVNVNAENSLDGPPIAYGIVNNDGRFELINAAGKA
jgi:hypothetical protein